MAKICSKCGVEKPLSDFHKDKQKPDGLTYSCKSCNTARSVYYKKKHPEQEKLRLKKYAQENPDIVRETKRRHKKLHPERMREASLKANHGITLADYNQLLLNQGGKCFVCLVDDKDLPNGLYVDHCHKTGKIRGLLCQRCNSALGFLRDSVDNAKRVIEYLEMNRE